MLARPERPEKREEANLISSDDEFPKQTAEIKKKLNTKSQQNVLLYKNCFDVLDHIWGTITKINACWTEKLFSGSGCF